MMEILTSLKEEMLKEYLEFIPLIKGLANDKRFEILIQLLDGSKSFQFLQEKTKLQKTALSSHIIQLLNTHLIIKPAIGVYQIQSDGINFLRLMNNYIKNSDFYRLKRFQKEEERQFSSSFLTDFFKLK